MSKARLAALAALGAIILDVFINFSVAVMNTAWDALIFVLVTIMVILMRKEDK